MFQRRTGSSVVRRVAPQTTVVPIKTPRRSNTAPSAGQTNPYTLFSYNTNGLVSQRDRRYDSGLRQVYDFSWDADDRLRLVQESGVTRFSW